MNGHRTSSSTSLELLWNFGSASRSSYGDKPESHSIEMEDQVLKSSSHYNGTGPNNALGLYAFTNFSPYGHHEGSWENSAEQSHSIVEVEYRQRNLLDLLELWKEKMRERWFQRNGVTASPTETCFDELIPELRSAEYAQRYLGNKVHSEHIKSSSLRDYGSAPSRFPNPYSSNALPSDPTSSPERNYIHSSHAGEYPPADETSSRYSSGTEPTSDSPREVDHSIKSPPTEVVILGQHNPPTQVLAVTSSDTSEGGEVTLLRKDNSDTEWGENNRGIIRVHRPAGVKWNQPMQCAYVSPITGARCQTSVTRGPDLERHLRTVHLRQEAQAVTDALIPRSRAKLLPVEWAVGDRLDFDCPYCSVRFTRDDARNRHVKMKH